MSLRSPLLLAFLCLATCSDDSTIYPSAPVELVVDSLGITHVFAKTDADAMWGAGYAMARDRLFQMELIRRQAMGTQSEIFGSSHITDDEGARTFNFRRLGAQDALRLRRERPGDAALLDAWVAGVNRRIVEVRTGKAPRPYGLREDQLNFVPELWTLNDTAAIGKLLSLGMSDTLDAELLATAFQRLVPEAFSHLPVMMPALDVFTMGNGGPLMTHGHFTPPPGSAAPPVKSAPPPFHLLNLFHRTGSNNWAVDGAHTDTGKPYVCGDPHQPYASPSVFYPQAMHGDTLDVAGFAFVGTPTVELGHNAHIGWTATTNFADVMDLWDVQVDSTFEHARLGGQLMTVFVRKEVIHVRLDDAPFGQNRDVELDVHEIPGYGVFLPDDILPVPRSFLVDGQLLLNWTGFAPTPEAAAYLNIDRARNLDEFEKAASILEVGAANFVVADATGIDYYVHANVPDRGTPGQGVPMPWHAMEGTDARTLWTHGFLGPDKLPHVRSPARGFLVTANNDPWGFTADGNVDNDAFYYGSFYDKGFRAHRIEQQLGGLVAAGKVTRSDMETLQGDTYSTIAEILVPPLADAVAAIGTDPSLDTWAPRKAELSALAAKLSAWDRRFVRDAGEPVILEGLEWFAARRAFEQAVTAPLFDAAAHKSAATVLGFLINLVQGRYGDPHYFVHDGLPALLVAALADTADWLDARFGTMPYAWKDVHSARFGAEWGTDDDGGQDAVDGHNDTINVSEAPFFSEAQPVDISQATDGPVYRMVIGFDADGTPAATLDFTRGASEDPADPHFADRQPDWVAVRHVPLPFRRADVDQQATSRTVLTTP